MDWVSIIIIGMMVFLVLLVLITISLSIYECWHVSGIVIKKTFIPAHYEKRMSPRMIGKVVYYLPETVWVDDAYWLKVKQENGKTKEFRVRKADYERATLDKYYEPS